MKQNPQDWLPVGQRVYVRSAPSPINHDGRHTVGTIVEHLHSGGVVVKFDNYFATWDYTAREARRFDRVY